MTTHRIELAEKSLLGISLGDAFGERFFGERESVLKHIQEQSVPPGALWEFTDDTVMAIAVCEQMRKYGGIRQAELAARFAENHDKDPNRGYGATARRVLRRISEGGDWREVAPSVFDGMGSMGNGASMRVGSIGAYHYDNFKKVQTSATQSAEVTHSHPEGVAGAVAVGIATAFATQIKQTGTYPTPSDFILEVAARLPDTDTKAKIKKAATLPAHYHIRTLQSILGNGHRMLAQDTVPFCIWCAAHHLHDFEAALWKAVSVLGDWDTICAIVGGIVIMSCEESSVPTLWLESVESVKGSPFWK